MRSPELLNDSFQFFIWFRQVVSEILYICGDFLDFGVNLIYEVSSLSDVSFQGVNLIVDHIHIIVNDFLSFLPFLHFLHLNFSDVIIEVFSLGIVWENSIVGIVGQ